MGVSSAAHAGSTSAPGGAKVETKRKERGLMHGDQSGDSWQLAQGSTGLESLELTTELTELHGEQLSLWVPLNSNGDWMHTQTTATRNLRVTP